MRIDPRTQFDPRLLVPAAVIGLIVLVVLIAAIGSTPSKSVSLEVGMGRGEAAEKLARLSVEEGADQPADLASDGWTDEAAWSYTTRVRVPMDRKAFGVIPLGHPDKDLCLTAVDGAFHLHEPGSGGLLSNLVDACTLDYDEWWELQPGGTWEKTSTDDEAEKNTEDW